MTQVREAQQRLKNRAIRLEASVKAYQAHTLFNHEAKELAADLRTVLAALSAPQEIGGERTVAWLLEWPADDNTPTRWWNPQTGWMIDAKKACWFAREADAESYKAQSKMHGVTVSTEHVFGLALPPSGDKGTGEPRAYSDDGFERETDGPYAPAPAQPIQPDPNVAEAIADFEHGVEASLPERNELHRTAVSLADQLQTEREMLAKAPSAVDGGGEG